MCLGAGEGSSRRFPVLAGSQHLFFPVSALNRIWRRRLLLVCSLATFEVALPMTDLAAILRTILTWKATSKFGALLLMASGPFQLQKQVNLETVSIWSPILPIQVLNSKMKSSGKNEIKMFFPWVLPCQLTSRPTNEWNGAKWFGSKET